MIRVGIIGMGRSGWELHAAPLSKMPEYKVAAVCDQSEARVNEAAKEFGAKPYTDASAVLANPDIDLVVVSVPGHLHAKVSIAAMEAGKDVVIEKPMANSLAEADDMLAAAQRTGRRLVAFHNRHWDRDYQTLKALVDKGTLGELLTLDSRVMTYGPEWTTYGVAEFNPHWRLEAAYGGGFLADWGPHLVEQILDLVGETPKTVTCQLRSHLWAKEVEDYFFMRLVFPSGLVSSVEGSNNARVPLPRWFVVGSTGTLVAPGDWGKWTEFKIRGEFAGLNMDLLPQEIGPSSGGKNYDVGDELSASFYTDLAEALATGRETAVTAQRAREVMAVIQAARDSNSTGKSVELA